MSVFSFRAESHVDIERFKQAATDAGIVLTIAVQDGAVFSDCQIETSAPLGSLRRVLDGVPDGHVMLETLRECPLVENSLERGALNERNGLDTRAAQARAGERGSGFVARNDPSLVLVPDWSAFVEWAKEARYDEAYLDINDSRCMALQEQFLEEFSVADECSVDDPLRALIAKHAELLADGPYAHYCYFELAYTRHTGWMAWLCSNHREEDPDRVVLATGQGLTPDEACRSALLGMTPNAPSPAEGPGVARASGVSYGPYGRGYERYQYLPRAAQDAIEHLDREPKVRTAAHLDTLLDEYAARCGVVIDAHARESAQYICGRRFHDFQAHGDAHEGEGAVVEHAGPVGPRR
jgi:hypothetical protein